MERLGGDAWTRGWGGTNPGADLAPARPQTGLFRRPGRPNDWRCSKRTPRRTERRRHRQELAAAAAVSCAVSTNAVWNAMVWIAAAHVRWDDEDQRLRAHVLHLICQHNASVGIEHGDLDQHVRGRFWLRWLACNVPHRPNHSENHLHRPRG